MQLLSTDGVRKAQSARPVTVTSQVLDDERTRRRRSACGGAAPGSGASLWGRMAAREDLKYRAQWKATLSFVSVAADKAGRKWSLAAFHAAGGEEGSWHGGKAALDPLKGQIGFLRQRGMHGNWPENTGGWALIRPSGDESLMNQTDQKQQNDNDSNVWFYCLPCQ